MHFNLFFVHHHFTSVTVSVLGREEKNHQCEFVVPTYLFFAFFMFSDMLEIVFHSPDINLSQSQKPIKCNFVVRTLSCTWWMNNELNGKKSKDFQCITRFLVGVGEFNYVGRNFYFIKKIKYWNLQIEIFLLSWFDR